MAINLLDPIGNWNPQLFRELKGRLQPHNLLLATAASILGQALIIFYYWGALIRNEHRYCLLSTGSMQVPCTDKILGNAVTINNWALWWQDIFFFISLTAIFVLPVMGIYLLVRDIDREERHGTLNFLRLSPQSASQILLGKMVGVPILLYLFAGLAIPFHLWAGLSAGVSLGEIFAFYSVLVAGCVFFYSAALLWSLTTTWLGGFQAWLGGGLVGFLFMLICNDSFTRESNVFNRVMNLFCPAIVLPHLQRVTSDIGHGNTLPYGIQSILHWQFFHVALGSSLFGTVCFMILNYMLWSYWCWQGLQRCFQRSNRPVLSKIQSYWLVGCFNLLLLGLAIGEYVPSQKYYSPEFPPDSLESIVEWIVANFQSILCLNLILSLGLMLALSPQRQSVIDWARYRREHAETRRISLQQDLIWGEKSPAIVAIVLTTLISGLIIAPWILISWPNEAPKLSALASLGLNILVITVYAVITQLLMLMRSPKRIMWTSIGLSSVVLLPIVILGVFSLEPDIGAGVWLLTGLHWMAIEHIEFGLVAFSMLSQFTAMILLNLRLARQVHRFGESATKALMNDRRALSSRA